MMTPKWSPIGWMLFPFYVRMQQLIVEILRKSIRYVIYTNYVIMLVYYLYYALYIYIYIYICNIFFS